MKGHPDDHLADRFDGFGALDAVEWMVETQGWAFTSVAPSRELDPPRPAYGYTVGLPAAVGYPDIVLCGLSSSAANGLLTMVVGLLAGGTELPVGPELVGVLDNDLRCRFVPLPVEVRRAWMPLATAFYDGVDHDAVQLLYPDRHGAMPYEESFDPRLRFAQPVLAVDGLDD